MMSALRRGRGVGKYRWGGSSVQATSRGCVIAAGLLLFLDSAGTLHAAYTVTLSYLFIALACVLGLPQLIRRWSSLPFAIRYAVPSLLAVYVVAALVGHPSTLPGSTRGGSYREYVYLADLVLGSTSMLLVPVLFAERPVFPLIRGIATAGALAGTYALYQWFALRLGLPLTNINNTVNSNGGMAGAYQGQGLFGGERVRGTFLEPHFLGAFLASTLPLQVFTTAILRRQARVLSALGMLFSGGAVLLTDSAPSWGMLLLASLVAGLAYSVGRGWALTASVLAVAALGVCLVAVAAVADPGILATITGRNTAMADFTTAFRTRTWQEGLRVWRHWPILGRGPGQSAVDLAYASAAPKLPRSLISAQGIWMSALLDAGVLGLVTWIGTVGSVLVAGVRAVVRRPSAMRTAALASALAVTSEVLVSGDRLFPRDWLILGLVLAVATARTDVVRPEL